MPKPILISGAGLSGLLLARSLRSRNIPFELYERDSAGCMYACIDVLYVYYMQACIDVCILYACTTIRLLVGARAMHHQRMPILPVSK